MESLSLWRKGTLMSRLFWPALVEQLLSVTIGIVGTALVSGAGAAVTSGVSLVDQFNNVLIAIFSSVAMAITVVVAQNIGAGSGEKAGKTAAQSLASVIGAACLISVLLLIGGNNFLHFMYSRTEADVLKAGNIYLFFSAFSYPFIALSLVSTNIMRASGNSRTPLYCAIISNIINIGVAVALINWLHLGVYAVSIAALAARAVSGTLAYILLKRGRAGFTVPKITLKVEKSVIRPVLSIGIPSSIEQVVFQSVRLLLGSIMAGMGTSALLAHQISLTVSGIAISVGTTFITVSATIIGQAYGARDYRTVKRSALTLCAESMVYQAVAALVIILFFKQIMGIYHATPEAIPIAWQVLSLNAIIQPLFWTGAFMLAQILRGVGDAKFVMYISVIAVFTVRVIGAWYLGVYLNWGIIGVWIGIYFDWILRCAFFIPRFLGRGWQKNIPRKTAKQ